MSAHEGDRRKGRRSSPAAVAGLLGIGLVAALAMTGGGAARVADSSAASGDRGFTPTECGTYSGQGCAPPDRRVDLGKPAFSNPTKITNPLFPISDLTSAVLLGRVDGKPFRSETTLLPGTRTIEWDGQKIATLASQYAAYGDGRIEEVALDRYAQADDGSVWYFGEDVVDYVDGNVVTTEGTWLAGVEGPPAMIMPATAKVGDVFRPENVLGIVFEEVTVKEIGVTVQSAHGPVTGAIVAQELHLDESTSDKTFAPGYGEFFSGKGSATEKLAVALPADARPGPPPQLESLKTSATGMLGSVRAEDWEAAAATLRRMNAAWDVVRGQKQPALVAARLSDALEALARAVRARKAAHASQATIDAAQSILDLRLAHRPPAEIDRARFELWTQQVLVHAAARDSAGVSGDVATLEWIRDRIAETLEPGELAEVDSRLRATRTAADAKRLAAAADHAVRLGQRLRSL